MDETKKAFTSLMNFPPELWASVTDFLYLDHIARLKLTGNKTLWSRLCAERAVKVINARKEEIVFKGWPTFLREFPRIEKVIIGGHHSDSLAWWENLSPKLDQMPKTLKKLFLAGPEKINSEFFVSADQKRLSLIEYVPMLECLDIELTWSVSDPWMGPFTMHELNQANFALLPPNLVSLTCSGWDVSHPLPASLTQFEAPGEIENSEATSSEWSFNFPSTITDLSINYDAADKDSFLRELPPSLTKFSSGYFLSKSIELLPQSVTDLDIVFGESIMQHPKLPYSPSEILPWPCSLRRLNIDYLPHQCLPFLPNTLTDLHIYFFKPCETESLDHPIFTLPKSLTKLHIYFEEKTFIDYHSESPKSESATGSKIQTMIDFYRSMAPRSRSSTSNLSHSKSYRFPNLVKLVLVNGQLSPRAASQLPPTLRWLQICNVDSNVCKQLPAGITRLAANHTAITPELIKFVPRSVIHLILSSTELEQPWFDYYDNGRVTTASEMMEMYGEDFTFSPSSDLLWQGEAVLPAGLIYLQIDMLEEVGDAFLQNQKLPYLTSLDMPKARLMTDLSIPLLCQHLTLLDISRSSAISGESFQFLPRGLWYLSLYSSNRIYDSHIPFLPPKLEFLSLYSATLLTDDSIPLFPRTLADLNLGSNHLISTKALPLLPPKILDPNAYHTFSTGTWTVSQGKAHSTQDFM